LRDCESFHWEDGDGRATLPKMMLDDYPNGDAVVKDQRSGQAIPW
jgi:hypothetical protein